MSGFNPAFPLSSFTFIKRLFSSSSAIRVVSLSMRLLIFLPALLIPACASSTLAFHIMYSASLVAQLIRNPPAMQETWVQSLGWEDSLEKGKATYSSMLAWRILWTVCPWGCKELDMTEQLFLSLSNRVTVYNLDYSFPYLEPVCCSLFSSNCCFLTCIQISQEAGKIVWYSHLFKNFLQFVLIYTVNGFGIVLLYSKTFYIMTPNDQEHQKRKCRTFSAKSGEKVTAIERTSSVHSKNFFRARHTLYSLSVLKKIFFYQKRNTFQK